MAKHEIAESEWAKVASYLWKLNETQIKRLGGLMGLSASNISHMKELPDDMVSALLRGEEDVTKVCGNTLTWETLAEKLNSEDMMPAQNKLAEKILKEKCQTHDQPQNSGTTSVVRQQDQPSTSAGFSQIPGEQVGGPVFKEPLPLPDGWDPPETDSAEGPCKTTSYAPYPRKIKADRTIKYKPKLKLGKDPKELTTLNTGPIQLPSSLVVGNYHMKSARKSVRNGHGLALIINNENFTTGGPSSQRKGTHRDVYNLVETFRFLGYRVEIRHDCLKEEVEELFDHISPMIKKEDDSFVCCILSHGNNNTVKGSDCGDVILRTEKNSLEMKLSKCTKLEGKPKLFFVSTCRSPVKNDDDEKPEADSYQNPRADFAFNYATLPGEVSWRYAQTGTFYIQKLCKFLCENATKATLTDIQKMVAQEVTRMDKKQQLPNIEDQTTKNVYFFDDFFETRL